METIGQRIKRLRNNLHLSPKDLADKIGKDRATVYRYERDDIKDLPSTILEPLAIALNTTPGYIITGETKEKDNKTIIKVPVFAAVAAGIPISAIEEVVDTEEIKVCASDNRKYFGLKIKGASMEPVISEGSTVIVRQQETCEDGQVAIVLVNGSDATVKQVHFTNNGIMLVGYNASVYAPHFYNQDEVNSLPVNILGVVVESRKKFE